MKTYVITASRNFPATHPRKGESTGFVEAIQSLFTDKQTKIHTIRANCDLWKKRIDEVNAGKAVLSIRYWTGKPYNSKQEEILQLTGVGIQKILFDDGRITMPYVEMNGPYIRIETLSKNDGLCFQDFADWFKGYDLSKPMVIIQFTNFRY